MKPAVYKLINDEGRHISNHGDIEACAQSFIGNRRSVDLFVFFFQLSCPFGVRNLKYLTIAR